MAGDSKCAVTMISVDNKIWASECILDDCWQDDVGATAQ